LSFLGAKSTSILDCVRWLVGWSVRRSVRPPRCNYVENWLRRDCFERRRRKRITSRFHYVAIPLHLGNRRSPCFVNRLAVHLSFTSKWSYIAPRLRCGTVGYLQLACKEVKWHINICKKSGCRACE
jgi:hypothetical protein